MTLRLHGLRKYLLVHYLKIGSFILNKNFREDVVKLEITICTLIDEFIFNRYSEIWVANIPTDFN